MAKLVIKSEARGDQVIYLNLGVNRLGRDLSNDFSIEHPSISARHCEIHLSSQGVTLRDCGSTNGTFLNGHPVHEARLDAGHVIRLGDVELLVESVDATVAIPQVEVPRPAPPIILSDGGLVCPRHAGARVTHQCTHCKELLCDACVHRLRRRGGRLLKLCPLCSHLCKVLGQPKPKRKSILDFLHKTVKLPFLRDKRNAS
jgi:hypothetical protein